MENMNAQGGEGRVKCSQIFGFFILLHKRIQIDSHKYTTAYV